MQTLREMIENKFYVIPDHSEEKIRLNKILDEAQEKVMEFYRKLDLKKEEIIQAFIAQHGCMPDQIQIVEQETEHGRKFWVELRKPVKKRKNK